MRQSLGIWCPEPESNRHALRLQILSLLCLPISSSGQLMRRYCIQKRQSHLALARKADRQVAQNRGCGLFLMILRVGNGPANELCQHLVTGDTAGRQAHCFRRFGVLCQLRTLIYTLAKTITKGLSLKVGSTLAKIDHGTE